MNHALKKNVHRFAISTLVIATSAMIVACGKKPEQGPMGAGGMPPPSPVTTVELHPESVPVTYEYAAQILGVKEVEVRARVTGILRQRLFQEGGTVKAGQSLFQIDPVPFETAVAKAQADVVSAQARMDQARRNLQRIAPLQETKAVSQKEIDDATSAQQIASADLTAAQARLNEAQLNLRYSRVESPITGVASRALKSEGSLVSGPDVLLTTVSQLDKVYVLFGLPDNEQLKIRALVDQGALKLPKGGFTVTVKNADGSEHPAKGVLNFADARINPSTGTSEARAEIDNPKQMLRPGQFVRAVLTGGERVNAFVVPQRAVLEGPAGKFVYVVDEKSTAQPRPVQLGDWTGTGWVVNGGVKDGDKVIVDGVMKLFRPGMPVAATPASAADKGSDAAPATPPSEAAAPAEKPAQPTASEPVKATPMKDKP